LPEIEDTTKDLTITLTTPPPMMGILSVKALANSDQVGASIRIAEYAGGPYTTPFQIQLPVGTVTVIADYENQHKQQTANIENQKTTPVTFQFVKPSPIYYPVTIHYELRGCCGNFGCNCEFSGDFACVIIDGVKRGNVPWSGQLQNRENDLCLGKWLGSFTKPAPCRYRVISGNCVEGWNGRLGCQTNPCKISSPPEAVDINSGTVLPKSYVGNVPHWKFTPKAPMDIWVTTVGF